MVVVRGYDEIAVGVFYAADHADEIYAPELGGSILGDERHGKAVADGGEPDPREGPQQERPRPRSAGRSYPPPFHRVGSQRRYVRHEARGIECGDRRSALAPHQHEGVTHRPLARRVTRRIQDTILNDHRGRAAAVEIERLVCAEPKHEAAELDGRHSGAGPGATVHGHEVERGAVAAEAHGGARVANSHVVRNRALELPGAGGDVDAVADEPRPAADQQREERRARRGARPAHEPPPRANPPAPPRERLVPDEPPPGS